MEICSSEIKKVFIVLLLWLCFFSLEAQNPVESETRGGKIISKNGADTAKGDVYAIIMGVSTYPGVTPLKYAHADALLFSKFLQTPSGGNTRPENIKLLLNENANKNDFWGATGWLKNKNLKKGDSLYLYFSGHGIATTENVFYFLPYDCYPNKDENNYEMTGTIEISRVKYLVVKRYVDLGVKVILIMDACRSDEIPRDKETPINYTNESIVQKQMGEIMLLSTGNGQVSIESSSIGNGHGLYTYYLIDGLAGAADKEPFGDNNGKVTLDEIGGYLKIMVKKRAKTDFSIDQIPWSCCAEKDLETITKVDPQTLSAWEKNKGMQQMSTDQNLFAVNTAGPGIKGGDFSKNDTAQITIYNRFVEALTEDNLSGEASAETFYYEMEKQWPGNNLTEDAKYSLAAKYLNFCQQKINLFLNGKGLVHIIFMEKDQNENDNSAFNDLGEQIKKLKTLVTTGFDVADTLMGKALALLKKDPALVDQFLPQSYFINTMAAYSSKRKKLEDILQYCRKVIETDSISAAGYLLMGWIYQDMQNDSCKYYFEKAAAKAPKWAYPINGLGNYYISKNNRTKGLEYFSRAIEMDSLYSNAYRNLGMTYFNQYKKSKQIFSVINQKALALAKQNSKKAVEMDPCNSYAAEDYGNIHFEFISQNFGSLESDNQYFNICKRYFERSINCDPGFVSGYQKMSALYSRAKNEDSALYWLQECVRINPDNDDAYRNLGTYHLNNLKDSETAETDFLKAIALGPSKDDNYYALGRLYRKQKNRDKAIAVYNQAMNKIGNNKDLFNEIGNAYFEALPKSEFNKAISYYKKALEIDSTLAYVYYNLGKLFNVRNEIKDSSFHYYCKAVLYDPERFPKLNYEIADYYYNNKKANEAKAFYRKALEMGIASKKQLSWYVERLVSTLITEKNFTEAAAALDEYLDPETDKDLYTKLSTDISKASGKN